MRIHKIALFNIQYKTMNLFYLITIFIIDFLGNTSPASTASRVDILPYYQEASFTPYWFENEVDIPLGFHRIPDFQLTDQFGHTFSQSNLEDKIYVVDFFFTSCPGICPQMTQNMSSIQDAFLKEEDVVLLSYSVTPEYDSPDVLQEYAEIKGVVEGKWYLLTGDRKQIYTLGRDYYFVEEDLGIQKSAQDFLHTENFILVDKQGYLRGIYNGLSKTSVNQLIADIKTLQKQ